MGTSFSVATSEQVSRTQVQQSQVNNNQCLISSTQVTSGTNIVIEDAIVGDISVINKNVLDTNCVFNNNIENVAQSLIDQYNKTVAESQGGGLLLPITPLGFNVEITSSTTVQELALQLEQIINNTCSTNLSQTVEDTTIIIRRATTGNVDVGNQGDIKSYCVLNNLAKIQSQTETVQEADTNAGGRTGIFFTILAIIGVVILILIIVSVIAAVFKKPKGCQAVPKECEGKSGTQLDSCLKSYPLKKNQTYCPTNQVKSSGKKSV
jgi:hypothetical protein